METNDQLIDKLLAAITDCTTTLANPTSKKSDLLSAHDKVLGLVSSCNVAVNGFNAEQRLKYDNLYDKATAICHRTRRFASILK